MKKSRLGEIADVEISGIDKKTKDGESAVRLCNFTDVYYNWAITKNMYEGLMQASASDSDIETFSLCKGQVAITKDSETRDDIGVATYIADDFDDVVLGYHCALITPRTDVSEDEKIYGKYLNALLHTKYAQKYFSNNATGSGQRYTLSKEAIEDMPVYLPSFKEQVRIGDYLSDIDKKIETNNLINAELEALAKRIYDYWFVQFDFPNEEGKPYKSSGGKMVWNETLKREIPEGWKVDKVSNVLGKVVSTQRLSTNDYLDDGLFPIIDQATNNYIAGYTNMETAVSTQYPAVIFGDHSCAVKYVNFPFVRGADGTQVLISNNDRISEEYLYFSVGYVKMREGYARHFSFLKESLIVIPNTKQAEDFKSIASSLFSHITHKREEIRSLSNLRDYLLPLLMNGQITVKD